MHKNPDASASSFLKRQFIRAASLCGVYGLGPDPFPMRYARYDLSTSKWPETHAPLNIAIAADLHVGCPSVPLRKVEEIVSKLNAMQADVVLLLGDYLITTSRFDGTHVPAEPIAERLGQIKARYGVYAVLGNHDWHEDGQGLWAEMEKNNIHVLENDAVKLVRPGLKGQDIWIAGLADDTTRTPDMAKTFAKISGTDPVVMMCHDPGTFLDIDERPVVTLSGHTHGGQVRFPFAGALHLPSRAPLRYAYGHIRENLGDLIVSSGIGTSTLPLRFNCPAELVSLTLRPA